MNACSGGHGGQPGAGGGGSNTGSLTGTGGAGELIITYTPPTGKTIVPFALSTTNGGEFLIMDSVSFYTANSSVSVNDNVWHHLAATYDGATMKIYVDGSLTGSSAGYSGNLPSLAGALHIGGDYQATPGNFFNGLIDEPRVSGIARSVGWITTEYNNQSAPQGFLTLGAPGSAGHPAGLSSVGSVSGVSTITY